MAHKDDLTTALIKAHKSGDIEAAELFASKIKSLAVSPKKPETSSWGGRFASGMRDPTLGASQFAQNMSNPVSQWFANKTDQWLHKNTDGFLGSESGDLNKEIQQREQLYQSQLPENEGFDEARMLGNMTTGLIATKGLGAPKTMLSSVGQGMAVGGGMAATAPVTKDKYWKQKKTDLATGAIMGGALGPVGYGLGRVISPKFTNKEVVNQLKKAGITPTSGQTAGGVVNRTEQKLMSVPIAGDMIANRRMDAQKQFNTAMINKAIAPINKKVSGYGTQAIDDAHNLVSKSYDDVLGSSPGFVLDDVANAEISTLKQATKNLSDADISQFNRIYKNEVLRRLSPINGIDSKTYRILDTKLNNLVNSNRSKEDLHGALKELKHIFQRQASRTDPEFAKNLTNTKLAFKQMEAVKNASGAAGLQEGVFTPGQMVRGIKSADTTARKNYFKRGKAPMQSFAVNAQNVLGDTVPNSGTVDRMLMDVGLLGGAVVDPLSTTALIGGGSLLYTKPMQSILNYITTQRPEAAKLIAPAVSKSMPLLGGSLLSGN